MGSGDPEHNGEAKSSVLASEMRGPPECPQAPFRGPSGFCHAWIYQNGCGDVCILIHATLWGQWALWMCLSQVSQAPFCSRRLYPCGSHSMYTLRCRQSHGPCCPDCERPNSTWMKKGRKAPERGCLRSLIWVLKAISAFSTFIFINSSHLPSCSCHSFFSSFLSWILYYQSLLFPIKSIVRWYIFL